MYKLLQNLNSLKYSILALFIIIFSIFFREIYKVKDSPIFFILWIIIIFMLTNLIIGINYKFAYWFSENIITITKQSFKNGKWIKFLGIFFILFILYGIMYTNGSYFPNSIKTPYTFCFIISFFLLINATLRELYTCSNLVYEISYDYFLDEIFLTLSKNMYKLSLYFFIGAIFIITVVSFIKLFFTQNNIDEMTKFFEIYFKDIKSIEDFANNKEVSNTIISVLSSSVITIVFSLISILVYILSAIKSYYSSLNEIRQEKFNFFDFKNIKVCKPD